MVPEQYLEYQQVFKKQALQDLPPQQKCNHAIDLKEGTEASNNCKIYPLNPEEQITLDMFLEDMLKRGYIFPSKSPFASPFFLVKKMMHKSSPSSMCNGDTTMFKSRKVMSGKLPSR